MTMVSFEVGLNSFCIVIWLKAYEVLGVECGGLNENGLHRLIYLNTWSPSYGTIWERLRGVAL